LIGLVCCVYLDLAGVHGQGKPPLTGSDIRLHQSAPHLDGSANAHHGRGVGSTACTAGLDLAGVHGLGKPPLTGSDIRLHQSVPLLDGSANAHHTGAECVTQA
jgi:hypothetical protein